MNRSPRKTVIFIVGPTASGKTRLATKLARRVGGEIVSCDSMQIYKGMRILSQAPSKAEMSLARHHLVSVIGPSKEYSVASFKRSASRAISDIVKRGKTPIVTGGTGLYAKALIDGLFPSPKADTAFRQRMAKYAARYGRNRLWSRLQRIDPVSAASIHPNDLRRVTRSLEIFHTTGRMMTELKSNTKGLNDIYDIRIFGIMRPRAALYRAIGERVDRMFAEGLVGEVRRLRKMRLSKTAAMALGLKEVSGYLDGENDLDTASQALKMNTRRFAKRQMTWFRADRRIVWVDLSKAGERKAIEKIVKTVRARG